MAKFNLGWLKDKNGEKFAPKTFLSQILSNDGKPFQNRVISIESKLAEHDEKIVNNEVISNHENRITQNTTNITNNTNNITSLSNRVTSNENTITTNTNRITDLETRVTNHETRFSPTQIILKDTVNGFDYIVEMQNGNLVSYGKCIGIKVLQLPDKNSQSLEIFDPTGLRVAVICEDGTEREITNYQLSDVVAMFVTISYTENGNTYTTSFKTAMRSIKNALIDFEYTENEDGTYTITAWKQTLNGEPSTEMIVPDSSLIKI